MKKIFASLVIASMFCVSAFAVNLPNTIPYQTIFSQGPVSVGTTDAMSALTVKGTIESEGTGG